MKSLFNKIFLSLALILSIASAAIITNSAPTYAKPEYISAEEDDNNNKDFETSSDCRYFLGMPSWDCGLNKNSDGTPAMNNQEELKDGIVIILANILTDMSVVAAYLVLGFAIYGGYLYIFSSGDPGKVQNGKKTLTRAFIGLAITSLSNVILTAIRFAFLNGASFSSCHDSAGTITQCVAPSAVITNALQWFIGTAGVVALIFVVVGGIGYVTSTGDATKLQKSKNTILYALIGLIVVAISEILVSFISGIIANAAP